MRPRIFAPLVLAVLMALAAGAEPPGELADAFDGPEGFLLTKQERKQWRSLESEAQAEAFVELFWARRDPDLSTAVNEFRRDFEMRVEAADAMYGYQDTRGAMSDRGRVLILLGRSQRTENRPAGAVVDNVRFPGSDPSYAGRTEGDGSYSERGATEIWQYDADALPVHVGQEYVYALFVEARVGLNDYVLDRSDRLNTWVLKLLKDLPAALIRHPDLEEVPRIGLLPGSAPASSEQLGWMDGSQVGWPEGAAAVAQEALVPGPRHLCWVHLWLPGSLAAPDLAVGRLHNAETGEATGTFAVAVSPASHHGSHAVELAVPVEAGRWRLDLALASGQTPLAATTVEVETTAVPAEGIVISPFCWGTEVEEVRDAEFGDPFNIGGWHVVPRHQPEVAASDSLNYLCLVIAPDSDTAPELRVTLTVELDGERLTRTPPQPADLSLLGPGVWLFGSGVPVSAFEQPGEYLLRVSLKDKTGEPRRDVEIPFTIR